MSDTIEGFPKFPVGTIVTSHLFFNPDVPKTVHLAEWDGAEYQYTLVNKRGVPDVGYLAKDLEVSNG